MSRTVTGLSTNGTFWAPAGSLAAAATAALLGGLNGATDRFAAICAGLSLGWSVYALRRGAPAKPSYQRATGSLGPAQVSAMVTGLAAAVVLAGRVVAEGGAAVLELARGAPLEAAPGSGALAEAAGWVLLTVALLVQAAIAGRGAAVSALFGLLVLGAMRLALLMPAGVQAPGGGYTRGLCSLVLLAAVAGVLWAFVIVQGWIHAVRRGRWFAGDLTRPPPGPTRWPGFQHACTAVGLLLVLLVCYHLGVGFDVRGLGGRGVALMVTCLSAGSGVALLCLLHRGWSDNLADLGMGLVSLAICCAAVMALPAEPQALSGRYPLIFNATLVGLALASWMWAWLGQVWLQQLDQGTAWTVAGRLIRPAWRVSFFAGLLALAVASLMTIWPRLSVVPEMDHSLGRFAAGVAGHLLLLAAALWSARRLRRSSFTGLAVLTVVSMLAFIYVRREPLTTVVF